MARLCVIWRFTVATQLHHGSRTGARSGVSADRPQSIQSIGTPMFEVQSKGDLNKPYKARSGSHSYSLAPTCAGPLSVELCRQRPRGCPPPSSIAFSGTGTEGPLMLAGSTAKLKSLHLGVADASSHPPDERAGLHECGKT
jgi:hypothetical protein